MAKHGTNAGAKWHYRRGERPCGPCREAANTARRERYMRQPLKVRQERYRRLLAGRGGGWVPQDRSCAVCEAPFRQATHNQTYCGPACREAARRARRGAGSHS